MSELKQETLNMLRVMGLVIILFESFDLVFIGNTKETKPESTQSSNMSTCPVLASVFLGSPLDIEAL